MNPTRYLGVIVSLALTPAAALLNPASANASSFMMLASSLRYAPQISAVNGTTAYGSTQYGGTSDGTVFKYKL